MKKTFTFFMFLCLLSCSKYEISEETEQISDIDSKDYSVGYSVVSQMLTQTKSDAATLEISPYVCDSDTLFYIANYDNGWKIIANDQRVSPVLAQDNTGQFNIEKIDNDNLNYWIQLIADYIKSFSLGEKDEEVRDNISFWESFPEIKIKNFLAKQPITKDVFDSLDGETYAWARELVSTTSNTTTNNVEPLTYTYWGQDWPWNNTLTFTFEQSGETVTFPAGCVPVALGQLFYFLHYNIGKPSGINYNFYLQGYTQIGSTYYFNFVPMDYDNPSSRWDAMALWNYNPDTVSNDFIYVSEYLQYIGNVLGVGYSMAGSGVPNISSSIFSSNGITYSNSSYNSNTVETYIRAGQPVMIVGYSNGGNGHCWLINGIIQRTTQTTNRYRWYRLPDGTYSAPPANTSYFTEYQAYALDPNLYDGKIQVEQSSYTQKMWKMNWGAEGAYDSGEYGLYANWGPGGNGPYNQNLQIYYNFQ